MLEFDTELDQKEVRLDDIFLCGDCNKEMKHVDQCTFKCFKCGQKFNN